MTSIAQIRKLFTSIFFLVLLFVRDSASFSLLSRSRESHIAFSGNQDPMSHIRPSLDDSKAFYSQALQVISSMEASPSCNRIATSLLLDSCQSIDGSKADAEAQTEDVKSMYAAQLALCEIASAGSPIPNSCKPLAASSESKNLRQTKLASSRKPHINNCLEALESRPQWWTSYSNNRQSAVAICRAARIYADKDELVKLHKTMAEVQSGASTVLYQATQQSREELRQVQEVFTMARRAFQDHLARDLEHSAANTRSYFEALKVGLTATLDTALSKVRSMASVVESQMMTLSDDLQNADLLSSNLERNIGSVLRTIVDGNSALTQSQMEHWETSRGAATELQTTLKNLQDGDVNVLVKKLSEMGGQLETSNQLIAAIYQRQNDIDERMGHLSQSFSQLETKADAFSAAQTRQAESQARLHNQMEVDMQVTQGYLSDVASSALHLQTTVAETASKIESMTAFARIFGNLFDWALVICAGVLGSSIMVLLLMLWRISKTASLLTLTTLILLTEQAGLHCLIGSLVKAIFHSSLGQFSDPFHRASVVFGVCLFGGVMYYSANSRLRKRFNRFYSIG